MAIIRSFTNGFEVTDYTEEINIVPNRWGLLQSLGLFEEVSVAEHTVTFEKHTTTEGLIVDRVRGERSNATTGKQRQIYSVPVPHFPLDSAILPGDVQGRRAYGNANAPDSVALVRAEKMEKLRRAHSDTLEFARAKAIVTGDVYSPNGTVALNWFTEFGVNRTTVDYTFGTASADMIAKGETAIAAMVDGLGNGQSINEILCICSPEFFTNLTTHASIRAAYQFYSSTQEPLRQRLGGTVVNREFVHGGIRYIEYRGAIGGQRLIPAGEAYFVPTGTDTFKTFFSPANKFDLVNTLGEQVYMFEYPSQKGDKIEIETEANFINVVRRPQALIKAISSN